MPKGLVTLAAAAALLGGAAAAQGGEVFEQGSSAVSVTEAIDVTIPERVALHLQEDYWQLSLESPPIGAPNSSSYNEGCYLVPKGDPRTFQTVVQDARIGSLHAVDNYPAVLLDEMSGAIRKDPVTGEYLKGTLICLNAKILQKFCNMEACELDVKVRRSFPKGSIPASYGQFFVSDEPLDYDTTNLDRYDSFFDVTGTPNGDKARAHEFFYRDGNIPGWLDDLIYEGFWFDGSEVAGTYSFDVQFLLVGF